MFTIDKYLSKSKEKIWSKFKKYILYFIFKYEFNKQLNRKNNKEKKKD
jgi:hypothetical protein